jgi:hypothetical protein
MIEDILEAPDGSKKCIPAKMHWLKAISYDEV